MFFFKYFKFFEAKWKCVIKYRFGSFQLLRVAYYSLRLLKLVAYLYWIDKLFLTKHLLSVGLEMVLN